METYWIARTSDGATWHEYQPELQVEQHRPWWELEAICAARGLTITRADAHCGEHWVALDTQDGKLTCGRSIKHHKGIGVVGASVEISMFVRRECADKWTWAVVGANGWYIADATAGVETVPAET